MERDKRPMRCAFDCTKGAYDECLGIQYVLMPRDSFTMGNLTLSHSHGVRSYHPPSMRVQTLLAPIEHTRASSPS